ncbi:MAG: hypothetical protein NC489_36735 [Ruminococcus flavefaciens]|nr:hypothetical protein [Ruminococcus flavefaciens]
MINIGDVVSFSYGKNILNGNVVVFIPKNIDAFKYREYFEEVKDSNCNFNFIEKYDRVIVMVATGKKKSILKAYAPAIAIVKKENDMKTYKVQGYINGKIQEGQFCGISIVDAINNAETFGYKDISKIELFNFRQ